MDSSELNELDYMDDSAFAADCLQEGSESWSWEQNKAFETALATHWEQSSHRWEKIAADVGKAVEDVVNHYQLLEEDIVAIDGDQVPLPSYWEDDAVDGGSHGGKKGGDGKAPRAEQERRKGIAWSEEEHRLFLLGLKKFGKGDWRSISRNFVVTRTPTQVASHAQKYFIRLQSGTKDKRRSSIHDITSVNDGDSQGPITGQNESASAPGMPANQFYQPPPGGNSPIPSGPAIGRPVVGPHAVGTPVPVPSNSLPHLAYRMQPPVPNLGIPGARTMEDQMENVYPEHQMENAYPGNQMDNAYQDTQMENAYPETQMENVQPDNQKKSTKNTYPKSHKRR